MGCDHAGYPLKEALKVFLNEEGTRSLDLGTDSEEMVDYPDFCAAAARAVVDGRADRGIVLGGSGQGEQLAANKVQGVRAALCNDLHLAELSRRHNDANVLAMGGRIVAVAAREGDRPAVAGDAVRGRASRAHGCSRWPRSNEENADAEHGRRDGFVADWDALARTGPGGRGRDRRRARGGSGRRCG